MQIGEWRQAADNHVRQFVANMFAWAEREPISTVHCAVGPLSARLRIRGDRLRQRIEPALAHARSAAGGPTHGLDLLVLDSAVGGLPPIPDWEFPHLNSRHLERMHFAPDGALCLRFDPDHRAWTAYDRAGARGVFWCEDAERLPFWEDGAPLKTLLHWATAGGAAAIFHAGAVTDGRRGALLVGAGGSGKSTTIAACVEVGLGLAGDDLVLVEAHSGCPPVAHMLYDTLKLDDAALARLSWLDPRLGTPSGDKTLFRLSAIAPHQLRAGFPIHAILCPQVAHAARTRIAPASPALGLRALGPSTVFMLRGFEEQTIAKASALARRVPVHVVHLGADPLEAAGSIATWLAGLDQ